MQRAMCSTPKKQGSAFPKRSMSIKKLEQQDYDGLVKEHKSYGRFVSYCMHEKIPLNKKQRRGVLERTMSNRDPVPSK